ISAGTIADGIANALPTTTALSVTGTLDLNGFGQQVASVTGSGIVTDSGAAATFTVNNAGADSFAGTFTGTNLSLTKTGIGTLTLSGASTYGGATTISAGTIADGIANALSTTTALAVTGTLDLNGFGQRVASVTGSGIVTDSGAAATFTVNNAGADAFAGTFTGTNLSLAKTGAGTLTLSGASIYGGTTTISAGVLQIGNGSTTGSITGDVTDNASLVFNRGDTYTFGGNISGSGTVTQQGPGTLVLTGSNSYIGGTTISVGTIQFGQNSALGTGTVTLGDANTGANATALLATAPMNDDSGPVNGGAIANDIVVSSQGTGTATIGTTSFSPGGGFNSTTFTGNITLNRATTFQGGNGDRTTFLGVISGNVGTLTIDGGARVLIGGAADNTFVGNVQLTGSGTILQLSGSADVIPDSSNVDLGTGTTLYMTKASGAESINALTGTGTVSTNIGGLQTLTVGAGGGSGTFGGVIQDGAGTLALTKAGAGTETLTGANTYTGGTTISGGTLQIGTGGGTGSIVGAITDNSILDVNRSGSLSLSGITGSGSLIKDGSGTLILTGTNTYGGGTTINSGTLQLGDGVTDGTITGDVLDNGILAFNQTAPYTFTGKITGSGSVIDSGTGTLTLTNGGSTFSGGTTVVTGVLEVASSGALGTNTASLDAGTELRGTANVTLANTVSFAAGGTSTISAATGTVLTLGSLTIPTGAAAVFGSAGNTGVVTVGPLTGSMSVDPTATIEVAFGTLRNGSTGPNLGFFTGSVASTTIDAGATLDVNDFNMAVKNLLGSGSVTLGSNSATVLTLLNGNFSGVISGAGGIEMNDLGAGNTLFLTGANTYQGGTTITSGTLKLGDGSTPGASLGSGPVTIASAGTLTLDLAAGETFANAITDNGHIIADDAPAGDYTISSIITGTGDFTKTGGNTVTLTGNNTYHGGTVISGGTLLVNNTAGSGTGDGPVTVNSGTTLGGSGNAGGAITLNSGGFIAPGTATPGLAGTTLHGGSLTWNGGGTLTLQLGATGDQLALTGALTKGTGSGFNLNLLDAGITHPNYTLATFNGTTFTAGDFTLTLPAGYTLGGLVQTSTELDLILAFAASGPIIENSAPVGTPFFADFTVNGAVTTGGPNDNNEIRTLTFTPGSSLLIHNTLYVTQGPVILVGGSTLTLDGSLSASQLQMLFGSLLNGNGSIIGDLINAGLLSPGHSPGHIHVSGNYTQTPTGTLKIEIGGRDLTQHDLLTVGGTANLNGTLQLVRLDKFKLKRNEPVTFLTANGGVSGRFSMVENGFTSDTILQPTVVYHQDSVALQAVQGSFETFAQNSGLT
ncbi:MAG: autotransporter-associated beta strand repeat-containing protein, partial [Chthoniobacter sp.]|nr:autotransporter-associated beta strand repeat-containing protein [Chthoniobacter sp.]